MTRSRALRRPWAAWLLSAALLAGAACAPPSEPVVVPERASYPGFDTYAYPGDAALRAWRGSSPYFWIGYYLASPCHRETSWMGRRQAILDAGWGIALLYVGQQTWEGAQQVTPPGADTTAVRTDTAAVAVPTDTSALVTAPPACAPSQLTAERGAVDGQDAVVKAVTEAFPVGTTIFLNIERMDTVPAEMLAYFRAWIRQLVADRRFRPGLYAHARNASELHAVLTEELRTAGMTEAPEVWVASSANFDLTRTAPDVGLPFATVWQGAFDVSESWNGVTLRIDRNVARWWSPSMPR